MHCNPKNLVLVNPKCGFIVNIGSSCTQSCLRPTDVGHPPEPMSVPHSADDLFILLSKHINYDVTKYVNSKGGLFSYNYNANCKDIEQIRYFKNLLLGLAQDHPRSLCAHCKSNVGTLRYGRRWTYRRCSLDQGIRKVTLGDWGILACKT